MSGKKTAVQSGNALKQQVAALARQLGLKADMEVKAARRLWGQRRYIDVVITDQNSGKRLGVECKFQSVPGTAEEKIPAVIEDIAHWPIPGIVVIDGKGFSPNMQGYLMSTGKVIWLDDLEEWLCLHFGL